MRAGLKFMANVCFFQGSEKSGRPEYSEIPLTHPGPMRIELQSPEKAPTDLPSLQSQQMMMMGPKKKSEGSSPGDTVLSVFFSLPETNSSHLKMVVSNRNLLFQGCIFRGELLVSGSVLLYFPAFPTFPSFDLSTSWMGQDDQDDDDDDDEEGDDEDTEAFDVSSAQFCQNPQDSPDKGVYT